MASVWFLVLVLSWLFLAVFARDCTILRNLNSCNECLRCGGTWCNDLFADIKCSQSFDSWCPNHRVNENLKSPEEITGDGNLQPRHIDVHTNNGQPKYTAKFVYTGDVFTDTNVDIQQINSTIQDLKQDVHYSRNRPSYETSGDDSSYTVISFDFKPMYDFCPVKGRLYESVTFGIILKSLNVTKPAATVTFHVKCACDCCNEEFCNGNGDYVYEERACNCRDEWSGDTCEKKISDGGGKGIDGKVLPPITGNCPGDIVHNDGRGDIPTSGCTNQYGEICSNKGCCSSGHCICDIDQERNMYLDDYCMDLCTFTLDFCDSCFKDDPVKVGQCKGDCPNVYFIAHNGTLLNQTDEGRRKIWFECKKGDECAPYAMMKDTTTSNVYVMIINCENTESFVAAGGKVVIPLILGVAALIACIAGSAVAVYMWMKNRQTGNPSSQFAGYTNIDADNCTGVNPLYNSPISSYKNPTYCKS